MASSFILVACIYVFGGITVALINNYDLWSSQTSQQEHLRQQVQIYDLINDCIAQTPAERIIVFRTHNGGGRPSVSSHFGVSAMYGTNVRIDTKHLYQNITVDEHYTRMLLKLLKGKNFPIITSQMPDQLLKRIYINEKVKYSLAYPLCLMSTGLFYISFSTHKIAENEHDIPLFNDQHAIQYELLINSLNNILKKDEKKKSIFSRMFNLIKLKNQGIIKEPKK